MNAPVKNTVCFGLLLFFWVNIVFSQPPVQPEMAPLNPAFIQYMEGLEKGTWETKTEKGHFLGYIPPPFEFIVSSPAVKEHKTLPAVYDLRTTSSLPAIRNQGSCGSCWAFATMAAVESKLLIQGADPEDLSENHLKQNHGFFWGPCNGGNHMLSTAYLSRGSGPMREADAPYYDYDHSTYNGNPPAMYITDAVFLPKNEQIIKQAIMEHGALYTVMRWEQASYNNSNHTYYYGGGQVINHAVNLVGWDDNKQTAGGTGAWIVRNSWGSGWGDDGYFYIAYQDTQVNNTVAYWPNRIPYEANRVINYYDKLGGVSGVGYGRTTAYALVKFEAAETIELISLGTYLRATGTTIGFIVYGSFAGGVLSDELANIPPQTIAHAGYTTLNLPDPIQIDAGENYYVRAYYDTPANNFPVPIETEITNYAYPTIATGVCWISSGGAAWTAIGAGTIYPWNISVKAYGIEKALEDPRELTATTDGDARIDLVWEKNVANDNVMLAWSPNNVFGTPSDGTIHTAGSNIPGGGTVLYHGSETSFAHTELTPATTYYYKAFSCDSDNTYSPGVLAQATTASPLPTTYNLHLEAEPVHAGTVHGAGEYEEGAFVSVTASSSEAWVFTAWSGDTEYLDDENAAEAMATMPAYHISLTANFQPLDEGVPENRELDDESIADGDTECFDALQNITVLDFSVEAGGSATLIAGQNIVLLPGARIEPGGYFHAYITQDDTYCAGPVAKELDAEEVIVAAAETPVRIREDLFFEVFPNPTQGSFTLELTSVDPEQNRTVEVLTMLGRRLHIQALPPQRQHTLSLEGHPPGLYIIRVMEGNKVGVERLIKR